MPSRHILIQNSTAPHHHHHHQHHRHRIVPSIIGGVAAVIIVLVALIIYYFHKLKHKSTFTFNSTDSKPPNRFSYASLRRATSSFADSRLLGQGGFGTVYAGTLTNHRDIAVKVMDAGSLQGEREFQNELYLAAKFESKYILSVVGFYSDRKRRRMLLVYDLMTNGSLQHCLFQCKSIQLQFWRIRFSIALDIAKGLEYLHHYCDPPVIHGDIKPSNILLDSNFNAKIGDFGLASLILKDPSIIEINKDVTNENSGSVVKEADSSPVDALSICLDRSPESCVRLKIGEASLELASPDISSPLEIDTASVCEENIDRASVECGKETPDGKAMKSGSRKDWWWKQDNGGGQRGPVKDYVMEWIGNEIKKERPKSDWIGGASSSGVMAKSERKKKSRKTLDWWVSLDDDKNLKKDKRRPAREWWKEEYCEELTRKKKEKKKQGNNMCTNDNVNGENWWPRDNEDLYVERKTKRSRSKGSQASVDWYFDGVSSELGKARRSSHDSVSGDIPKSGVSSTPSMRGTVCYIAPEYCTGATVSDKCDVYSFGVVLLVLISGRRPLQLTESPMREFQRANLLYWTRHLARAGKLLDLVDESIHALDSEQALLCITVALLCLQKSPIHRPSMKEVVAMLSGDLEPPQLPVELSHSPTYPFASKSHKKPR